MYKYLNAWPFNDIAIVVCGKVGIPLTSLTIPIWWLSSLKLTVPSRSALTVKSNFLVASLCCHFPCGVLYGCKAFCHRTELDLCIFSSARDASFLYNDVSV